MSGSDACLRERDFEPKDDSCIQLLKIFCLHVATPGVLAEFSLSIEISDDLPNVSQDEF